MRIRKRGLEAVLVGNTISSKFRNLFDVGEEIVLPNKKLIVRSVGNSPYVDGVYNYYVDII